MTPNKPLQGHLKKGEDQFTQWQQWALDSMEFQLRLEERIRQMIATNQDQQTVKFSEISADAERELEAFDREIRGIK